MFTAPDKKKKKNNRYSLILKKKLFQEEVKPAPTQMMTDFSEGSVGRLVIRKSGKAQLIIGNVTMDVSMGTKCNFLQVIIKLYH